MTVEKFTDILAWQKAHELVLIIYKAVKYLPDFEKYNLISQMTRAAVSIPSNITEGFNKATIVDSLKFYNIAQASLEELKYQTLLCKDLNYFSQKQYDYLLKREEEVGKILRGWTKSQIKNQKA
ncbi:MAG: four helix bundle protein [Candidatus Kuenenbacteria bacterium]